MPTGHGRRRHPGREFARPTHSGFKPLILGGERVPASGSGALRGTDRGAGLGWSEARDGEQAQFPDIAPEAVDGGVHIRPLSLSRPLFAETIIPPEVVDALPSLPDTSYPQGCLVFLTTDEKLYRNTDGSTWSTAVPTTDLLGEITETQIADDAITTPKIAALAVTAAEIAAGTITADKIAANTLTAGTIAAGAIGTDELAADAVIANVINAGGTVEIDSSGITIDDGALTLLDDYGSTVLTGAGFSGGWIDFLTSGVYNSHMGAGPGDGVTIDNATAPLAYWTVSTSGDPAAALAVHTADTGAGSGFGVEMRITGTNGASGDYVRLEQLVPVRKGSPVATARRAVRIMVRGYVSVAGPNMTLTLALQAVKGDGTTLVGSEYSNSRAVTPIDEIVGLDEVVEDLDATAAFVRVRLTVARATAPTGGASTFKLHAVHKDESESALLLGGVGGFPPPLIYSIYHSGSPDYPGLVIDPSYTETGDKALTLIGDTDISGALSVDNSVTAGATGGEPILIANNNFIEMVERSAGQPGAPSANQGRIFLRDNGSGKTQLCIRFSSGATQVIATQP